MTDNFGNHYLESGEFELQVGTASDQIHFNLPIYVGTRENIEPVSTETLKKTLTNGRTISVTGTVRDVQATPIAGVKIQVENSQTSVVTDRQGAYMLKVKDNERLIFSKNGYAVKHVEVEGQNDISIQMNKQ